MAFLGRHQRHPTRHTPANFWLLTGTLLRRHERDPDDMAFARAGRRAIEAALQHAARAPLASAGASRFTDAAIVRLRQDVTIRRALSSSAFTPAGAAPTTLAAVRALVGTPAGCGLALVIAGGAAVASGAAPIPTTATLVALCDASASHHHHPWHGADRLFGKSAVPEGKDEEVADDEDDEGRVSEELAVASLASSDDPAPLTGVKLIANLAREHWASLLVAVAVAIVASLLKMHGTRHVAALYDLIGKNPNKPGVPRGVPTKPLVELACVRCAEAVAKFLLAKVTGDARTAMEASLRRRIFACLLTEDTATMDRRSTWASAASGSDRRWPTSPTWWRDLSRAGSRRRRRRRTARRVSTGSRGRSPRWRSGWSRRGLYCSERWARCHPGRTGGPRR